MTTVVRLAGVFRCIIFKIEWRKNKNVNHLAAWHYHLKNEILLYFIIIALFFSFFGVFILLNWKNYCQKLGSLISKFAPRNMHIKPCKHDKCRLQSYHMNWKLCISSCTYLDQYWQSWLLQHCQRHSPYNCWIFWRSDSPATPLQSRCGVHGVFASYPSSASSQLKSHDTHSCVQTIYFNLNTFTLQC